MKYQKTHKFTVISTFSGGGGSSCGYIKAGGKVLLAAEYEKNAINTYKANFPNTPIFTKDIKNLTMGTITKITNIEKYELDILDGSPPCQGFSIAGNKNVCDPRNQLYNEYVRLLKNIQPKTFVMENVKGLISGKNKVIFKDILTQLKNCGYNVKARLMNSKWYNTATSRERVIIIGVREDLKKTPSYPKPEKHTITVKEALKDTKPDYKKYLNDTVRRFAKKCKPGESLTKHHPRGSFFNYRMINPNKPLTTILKNSYNQMFFEDYRILTPNEAKIISSFPENFKLTGTEAEKFGRVGNAVPPNMINAIATHIYNNFLKD